MSTDPARWTDAAVQSHLSAALPDLGPFGEPETLLGGLLNFAWRVPAENAEGGSVVLKVAPPYVADHPDIELDPKRIRFDAAALEALAPGGRLDGVASEHARAPRSLHFDADAHALVMEDLGARKDLSVWADDADKTSATHVGTELGAFLGRLHAQTLGATDLAKSFDNRASQNTRKAVQYDAVEQILKELDTPDAAVLGAQAHAVGETFLEPGRCLIMGDLWHASVLVKDKDKDAEESAPHAGIIDWELAHFGNPAQDLGHFGAHLWMLTEHAERAAQRQTLAIILTAFYEGYAEAAGDKLPELLAGNVLTDAATHAGCEILTRAAGTFTEGSPYEGMTRDDDPVREAVLHALALLRRPERAAFVTPLRIALL